MKLFSGKLYKINRLFWLLYPTFSAAVAASTMSRGSVRQVHENAKTVATWASYWSQHLSCDVTLLSAGDVVMIVDVCEVYVKVISQEGRGGWVNFQANECIPSDSVVEVVCSAN